MEVLVEVVLFLKSFSVQQVIVKEQVAFVDRDV